MNIKGAGDLGKVSFGTHETINGVYTSTKGDFASFSSEERGFSGYLELLRTNYRDAYSAVMDNAKIIDDFTAGLEDTGRLGPYATSKAVGGLSATDDYKKRVKNNFDSTLSDYKKWYACKLQCANLASERASMAVDIILLNSLK